MICCLTPKCSRPAITRGVCQTCYANIRNDISKGAIESWESLELVGLAEKPKARGRKRSAIHSSSWFPGLSIAIAV